MDLRRIDFLEKPTADQYSVAAHFTIKFCEALQRKGVDCRLIPEADYFKIPLEDPPQVTLQFNECPKDSQGRYLCDVTGMPHVALLLDPPFRVIHYTKNPKIILTCDDAAWDLILNDMGFKKHFFLPHAVDKTLLFDDSKKEFDVVMLASCFDYEELNAIMQKAFPPQMRIALNLAIAKTLSDSTTSFAHALLDILHKVLPKSKFTWSRIAPMLTILEMYLKGKDRSDLAKSIPSATVHVFGAPFPRTPWQKILGQQENIVLHEGVPFENALQVMRQSKILLNSSVKNKSGAHERIFAGLLSGALVVTHENPYLMQYFKDEESILFYRHWELDRLNDKVMKYLANEEKRKEIVERGREIVLKHHTWDQRATTLLHNLSFFL